MSPTTRAGIPIALQPNRPPILPNAERVARVQLPYWHWIVWLCPKCGCTTEHDRIRAGDKPGTFVYACSSAGCGNEVTLTF